MYIGEERIEVRDKRDERLEMKDERYERREMTGEKREERRDNELLSISSPPQ